jgi:hypothetical protein
MLRSPADIIAASQAGRRKSVRFLKNANLVAADGVWWDWSFASGQPSYDARIGVGLKFTPFVSVGNDAIFLPPVPAGMDRQLAGVTIRPATGSNNQIGISFEIYDLLGVYPLIDGDSTDLQTFDNTDVLPRYSDGDNVVAVLVNHVSPMVSAETGTLNYLSANGQTYSVPFGVALTGQNRVCSAFPGKVIGPIGMPQGNGCAGVKRLDSLSFDAPPGGLYAIYLVRLLGSFQYWTDPLSAAINPSPRPALEYCNCLQGGWDLPKIYDGATLGFFFMTLGGPRQTSFVGHFHFVWG